jgi:large subunit ribosomal protein L32e
MEHKRLLEVRKVQKNRKPHFRRKGCAKKVRIKDKWIRPKGLSHKMRMRLRGNPLCVSIGYRSPADVRGFTKSGFMPVVVFNVNDLMKLDHKLNTAVIGSTVGQRKRVEIIKKAKEMKIDVNNIQNGHKYITHVENDLKDRKDRKLNRAKSKEERIKHAEKKAQEKAVEDKKKASKESEKSIDERTEESHKKEQDEKNKVLTQKE